jgi:hypothetical protein
MEKLTGVKATVHLKTGYLELPEVLISEDILCIETDALDGLSLKELFRLFVKVEPIAESFSIWTKGVRSFWCRIGDESLVFHHSGTEHSLEPQVSDLKLMDWGKIGTVKFEEGGPVFSISGENSIEKATDFRRRHVTSYMKVFGQRMFEEKREFFFYTRNRKRRTYGMVNLTGDFPGLNTETLYVLFVYFLNENRGTFTHPECFQKMWTESILYFTVFCSGDETGGFLVNLTPEQKSQYAPPDLFHCDVSKWTKQGRIFFDADGTWIFDFDSDDASSSDSD